MLPGSSFAASSLEYYFLLVPFVQQGDSVLGLFLFCFVLSGPYSAPKFHIKTTLLPIFADLSNRYLLLFPEFLCTFQAHRLANTPILTIIYAKSPYASHLTYTALLIALVLESTLSDIVTPVLF